MKVFMLVAMLIALVVTAWLVLRDVQEQTAGISGPAVVKPIERAAEARRVQEAADKAMERKLDGVARE